MTALKKSLFLTFLIVGLTSCGTYRQPESFAEKMARYKANTDGRNIVPEYHVADVKMSSGRTIASIKSDSKKKAASDYSNKRLYFLTLYTQYNQLNKLTSSASPEIKVCPNFHSSLVEHKNKFPNYKNNKVDVDWNYLRDVVSKNPNSEGSQPVLSLPISKGTVRPKVKDVVANDSSNFDSDVVQEAFDTHVLKTYSELIELCEYGKSDNYYAYENLVTHVKKKNLNANSGNMGILLKTTLYSNEALIRSLKKAPKKVAPGKKTPSRGLASVNQQNPYTWEVHQRLGVEWANQYFEHLEK